MISVDKKTELISAILDNDGRIDQVLRNSWPEAWLHINMPLGSTRALMAIEARGARTPGRVADALGVSRTTVTGLLDRLEAEGLLTRAIDPSDRRSLVLTLTEKGRELVGQIYGNRRAPIEAALAAL